MRKLHRRHESMRRVVAWAAAGVLAATTLAGCGGGGGDGTPMLTWFALPDNGGAATRASECAEASGGAYRVQVETLPNNATSQREQLVRRLAAKDSSIDVLSTDVVYTAEFANAGFLRPYTADEKARLTAGMLEAPVKTGMWKDTLYAAPFKTNTQLLWYRKSLAAAAGVNPESPDFTWDDMIKAAVAQGKRVAVQGARYEGYMVLVNALVLGGGGQIVKDPEAGRNATPSLASPAGEKAAEIIGRPPFDGPGGAGPCHLPGRQRNVHGQLALRSCRGAQRRRGGHAESSPRRRHRLGALPARLRRQAQRSPTRRRQPRHRRVHPAFRSRGRAGRVRQRAAEGHPVHARRG